jgi:hypothetical protein
MNALRLALPLVGLTLALAGCAAEVNAEDTDSTSPEESALAVSRLKGTWESSTGPIYSITFTGKFAQTLGGGLRGHEFTAHIDTGIRCITTPCPSETDVTGIYKSVGNKMTLASFDRPTAEFARILGDYASTLTNGGKTLRLKKADGTIDQTFHRPAAGVACGTTTCGAGLVCCNPLMNICTPPGGFCIF